MSLMLRLNVNGPGSNTTSTPRQERPVASRIKRERSLSPEAQNQRRRIGRDPPAASRARGGGVRGPAQRRGGRGQSSRGRGLSRDRQVPTSTVDNDWGNPDSIHEFLEERGGRAEALQGPLFWHQQWFAVLQQLGHTKKTLYQRSQTCHSLITGQCAIPGNRCKRHHSFAYLMFAWTGAVLKHGEQNLRNQRVPSSALVTNNVVNICWYWTVHALPPRQRAFPSCEVPAPWSTMKCARNALEIEAAVNEGTIAQTRLHGFAALEEYIKSAYVQSVDDPLHEQYVKTMRAMTMTDNEIRQWGQLRAAKKLNRAPYGQTLGQGSNQQTLPQNTSNPKHGPQTSTGGAVPNPGPQTSTGGTVSNPGPQASTGDTNPEDDPQMLTEDLEEPLPMEGVDVETPTRNDSAVLSEDEIDCNVAGLFE